MSTMLYPTIQELTHGEYNRYELVVAVAKGTRMVTDENLEHQKDITTHETEKMNPSPKGESYVGCINDEKAMTTVVKRIKNGEYKIAYRANEE